MSAHPKVLAKQVALRVGLPASWPNVNVIAAAIELEAEACRVSADQAAEVIVSAAKERTCGPRYDCPSDWERRMIARDNDVNRFWFEDGRWRFKFAYQNFRAELDRERGEGIFAAEIA